jgi:hypothetical protein
MVLRKNSTEKYTPNMPGGKKKALLKLIGRHSLNITIYPIKYDTLCH